MTEELRAEELIFVLKKIGLNLTAQMEADLKYKNMSGSQIYFMVYILRHHPQGTYLTELCHEMGVSKSTLSTLIKKLRKEGYISFREDPDDIRKKELLPTPKLIEEGNRFLSRAARMESEICGALDQAERVQLWKLAGKLLKYFSRTEQSYLNKDRRLPYSEKSFTAARSL